VRAVSVALVFQLVSVPVGAEEKEKESEREREGGKEKKKKAERRNTKNFIRTTTRTRCALCMFGVESEHEESHCVVRIFPLHAVMLTRVDDNRTTRTENKSNVAIICRVPIIEFRSFV
jgi:hypothetical protein